MVNLIVLTATHKISESLIHAFPVAYLGDALVRLEKKKASLGKTQNATHVFQNRISGARRVADLTDQVFRSIGLELLFYAIL